MESSQPSLSYATQSLTEDHLRRARLYRRIALGFAVTPMSIGVVIVLFYWLFDWEWLAGVGRWMLPIGGLCVLAGLLFVIPWVIQQRVWARKTQTDFSWRATIVMILLLLSNFAVAFGCIIIGFFLIAQPSALVTIYNDTGAPLDQCSVRSVWSPRAARVLMAGDSMAEYFKENRSRGLHLHIEQMGKSKDVALTFPPGGSGKFGFHGQITIHVRAGLDVAVDSTPGG